MGDSLQYEAVTLSAGLVEELFSGSRKDRHTLSGTGFLTLDLTPQQKDIISWMARHPLLDLPTLQALVRPGADEQAVKPLQRQITRLFKLRLVETKLWPRGKTALEQQRYLLTDAALRFVATRGGEPFSAYFVSPKYRKSEDAIWRQWGTAGLYHQMEHTSGLYTCLATLLNGASTRGEVISDWRSAHEAARSYIDSFRQSFEHARPDAELVVARSSDGEAQTLLLEYDRGTTAEDHYQRKFKAYLDYQTATRIPLPTIVVITRHRKAAQVMQRVLAELGGSLPVVIVLERDLLSQGLTLILQPSSR